MTRTRSQRDVARMAFGLGLAAVLLWSVALPAAATTGSTPTAGTAVVDGDPGEWSAADEFGPLVAMNSADEVRASLSLRYDCNAEVLYALVQAVPGVTLRTTDPDEAYLRLGSNGNRVSGADGDFAWVGLDGDGAQGFEMSASVASGDNSSALRVHAKVIDGSADGYETIDLDPRTQDLSLPCGDAAVAARAADPQDPGDPGDPGSAVAGGGLVRTGLTDGVALLLVSGVLILGGVVALRVRRRLTSV